MFTLESNGVAIPSRRRVSSAFIAIVAACNLITATSASHELHEYWARQATISIATPQATPVAKAGGSLASGDIQTSTYAPIGQSMAPSTMTALPATYTAGTAAPINGAPKLPSTTLTVSSYPALDKIPPVDSPLVKQWLSQIDMTKVPGSAPSGLGGCSNQTNADLVLKAGAEGNCWWTCGGCTRDTDITACPDKGTWGASFDDGPSPDTPTLLRYLDQQKLKTTFFVVGSRVLSRPAMLQYEYESGHQISVHTWSHPYLTTLTNEEIVAELGWSKKVIKDVLGVTPNTMRPPYGDIDDRVRYIALAMGLTPIIWTTSPSGQTYDTQDWKISTGIVTPAQVLHNFQTIIGGASQLSTGFIVLAHDLYPQSVALAVEFVLPSALAAGNLTIEPIITCLGMPMSEGYYETANSTKATSNDKASNKTVSSSKASPSSSASTANLKAVSGSSPRSVVVNGIVLLTALMLTAISSQ